MLDLETLEAECEELLSTIRRIDLQLSERQPVGRVPDDEYRAWREWRSAALCAKSKATTRYRAKRKALKEARHAANDITPELLAVVEAARLVERGTSADEVINAIDGPLYESLRALDAKLARRAKND